MKSLFTCLLAIATTVSALAQTTSVVNQAVVNAEAVYYFHQRKVARSSNGVLMAVWIDIRSNTAGGQVQYSTYDAGFQIWSPPTVVSNAGDRARQPAIAADDNGNIHATWIQRNATSEEYQQYYAKYNGTSWGTPMQVSLGGTSRAEEGTIEAGSDGTVWIVYNTDAESAGNEWVLAVKSTDGGTTWSSTADTLSSGGSIGSSITNARVALTAGTGGKIVAVWHDGQPWDVDRREIFVNSFNGTSWSGQEMISDTTTSDRSANWYPAVAMDPSDNVYVVYHTNDGGGMPDRKLLLQKKTWNDPWSASTTTQIAVDTVGDLLSVSAVGDADGNVHVTYRRDTPSDTTGLDEIAYTYTSDGGSTWLTPIALSRDGHDGGYVSLANRVRAGSGIDALWREATSPGVNDGDSLDVVHGSIPSGLTGIRQETPLAFDLYTSYPNPFNPSTNLVFTLRTRGEVKLSIFDLNGRLVRTVFQGDMEAGSYELAWDGANNRGIHMSSGIYFSRLTAAGSSRTIKLLLLK